MCRETHRRSAGEIVVRARRHAACRASTIARRPRPVRRSERVFSTAKRASSSASLLRIGNVENSFRGWLEVDWTPSRAGEARCEQSLSVSTASISATIGIFARIPCQGLEAPSRRDTCGDLRYSGDSVSMSNNRTTPSGSLRLSVGTWARNRFGAASARLRRCGSSAAHRGHGRTSGPARRLSRRG